MNFHIISLFPGAFDSYLNESILKRAIEAKKISVNFYNPRSFAKVIKKGKKGERDFLDRIDDKPYGGGPGMVIEALPVIKAIEKAIAKIKKNKKPLIIWLTPSGKQFDTEGAKKIVSKNTDIIIICGRYEGIDARVKKVFKMTEMSVGPFVLTGGELPAMILIDCMARQVKGVLGSFDSLEERRISSADVYTRPEILIHKGKKLKVPKVLLCGDPKKINAWKMGEK